jgi:fatty acid desaturase
MEKAYEEKSVKAKNGMAFLLLWIFVYLLALAAAIIGAAWMDEGNGALGVPVFAVGLVWVCVGWIPFMGLRYSSLRRPWY